ncbi:glycosyltransferase family 4 protein [Anaerococcus nagyae]|uniref:glycosyltransferase family 4 protein n=1 Tax=Anaerococcus nagyae TaxID=1755241 RepID=UPI001AEA8413|nr:glycosyltransferase family 4 protein [Anaerococcus nagyae]MBP2068996.1 galacturonosyltransferase [Anaerococcus nagyae]
MGKKIMIVANDTSYFYRLRKEILERILINGNELVVVSKKTNFVREIEELGCKFINLDIPRHGTNPIDDLRLYRNIKRILKSEKPNLVFTYNIKPNVYFGIACNKLNIPFIPNITGLGGALLNPGFVQLISRNLYKAGLKKSKIVFFQNEFNKNFFLKNKIISNEKRYHVIPGSGINLGYYYYSDYPYANDTINFIMVSRIMRDKGITEYLDAAESIKSKYPNTVFTLVGDYDDLSFKDRIDNLNDNGIINYLGYRKDIDKLIRRSHCLIHPSYHEGLSNVLLEAGATGRPVIASDVPGCRETFVDGVSGLAVKVKDSEDLTHKIEEFINIPYEKKVQMGKANREHVSENFDRKIVVEKYIECIEKFAK